eukprot:TRINITY_DN17292_c0_g1_i1.p1 TRINITY_DN17292_c0_g1~~TRINITY_DN17292_c0_g1_i1.p1  ORF type:complete len:415 (-),score=87.46 TRINITY_DN17292_c0_g1_i1:118-1362(-)
MKGGFFAKPRPDPDAQFKPSPGRRIWRETEVEEMVKVFEEILDENSSLARKDLERRVRTGTGVREFRGQCGPIADVPEADRDVAYRLIQHYTKFATLCDFVPIVMEQTADIYKRVEEKGRRDGLVMDKESEIKVLRDIIKEALIRHVLKCVNTENSTNHASGSHDGGLLATPQGYTAGDLNELHADTIRDLMEKGSACQDEFMDEDTTRNIFREIELMDFDGKLTDVQQQKMIGVRKDKIGWFSLENVDREKQPGLVALFKKLISIPFELNKKCSLYCQACGNFQVAAYAKDAFYKKHVDGGYEDLNNGRKITAIFYPNDGYIEADGGCLRVYKRRDNPYQLEKKKKEGSETKEDVKDEVEDDIQPRGGRLVLFRARDVPHEVLIANKKRYAVSLFIPGPPGPGDQPDGHHTST